MNIFITGASGYIGNKLALQLANEGHTVQALCRNENVPSLQHPNIVIVKGDILDKESVLKAMHNCMSVYHLASYARTWAKDSSTYFRINVEGTKNILDCAAHYGIEKLVYTSSAGTLGPSFHKLVSEEDKRTLPFLNPYEESKHQAEQLVIEYAHNFGEAVIVQPSRVYGNGAEVDSNSVTKMIRWYMQGKWRFIPGNGNAVGNYVYVDDVVNGHLLAMKNGRSGERYLLGGVNATYHRFFETLIEVSGIDHRLFHLPIPFMKVVAGLMVLGNKITSLPPIITPSWVDKYMFNWALNSEKAINQLGYNITSLESGIKKTIFNFKKL